MNRCGRCQADNRPRRRFCAECGMPLGLACPSCGFANEPGERFCGGCGQLLGATPASPQFAAPASYTPTHLAEKILTFRSALEGERKQVTVLFCDLARSTVLAERLGPESMHALLSRFFELALSEVHRYEGTINQFLGDGFMALFGAPLAHEDHFRRAVLTALGIQQSLRDRHADFGLPPGEELSLRMGLNTGPVVVGKIGDNLRMDYTAVGDTTHLAARLQQLAMPGTIYVSETTHRLTEGHVEYQPLGAQRIKGKTEPVAVYKLLGFRAHPEPAQGRDVRQIGSPLVGRDGEVRAFLGCLERLLAGWGGIVGVIGEAGLGKSRLVTEVRRQVADRNLLWLEGRALSFGQTMSYWPFLEILKRWAGITEEDGEAESWAKVERGVRFLFPDEVAEILPYLATLLGVPVREEFQDRVKYLDGEAMGRQIFRTARRFFDRLARERPLVLVFEDLHWTDQSSTELIEHLFPLVESAPLLLVGVGRPERQSPAARLRAVAARTYPARYTEVALAPLSPSESTELVQNLLQSQELPPRLGELVLQKTEGNPFFVEEVMRALIDAGALVRDPATRAWRAPRPVEQLAIPDTVEGVILARVDRLEEEVKQVLKLASVIGRSFFYRILRGVAEAERQLDQDLAELQELELIREKRCRPELEYIFKHALVQEATYESILVDRRRELHRRVAECIETLFTDRPEEFYSLLAYHYVRAENWEKAQEYLFKAGDQAGRIAADAEALSHYRQAVAAYARAFGDRWDPLQRAMLERKVGEALFRRGDHQQALEYVQRALTYLGHPYPSTRGAVRRALLRQLVLQVGHRLLPALFVRQTSRPPDPVAEERAHLYEVMLWIDYFLDPERFMLTSLTELNFSEENGHSMGVVLGSMTAGLICDVIPAFRLGGYYHRQAVAPAERSRHPAAVGHAYLGQGLHEDYLGNVDRALEYLRRAATVFQQAGYLRGWGACTAQIAWLLQLRGAFTSSLEQSYELIRVGQEAFDRELWAWGLMTQAEVERWTGPLEQAVIHLGKAVELLKAIPDYASVAGGVPLDVEKARTHLPVRE